MEKRLEDLRAVMSEQHIDVVALGPGAHMAWLLNVRPHADERPLLCLISASHAGFLMPSLEAESARNQTDMTFYEWADDQGPEQALGKMLADFAITDAQSLVLDETMRADFAALLTDALPQAARQFTATSVGQLRMCKGEDEYAILKRNAQVADNAMLAAWAAMQPGMSEREVAELANKSFTEQNAVMAFGIIGTGSNGAYPHHHTGSTGLAEGDAVVMDIGAGLEGYYSDITRMAILGEAPQGFSEIHAIVNSAVEAALAAARPGVQAKVVDAAARNVITDAGYGEYFMHRTGHGLGTEIHEPPYVTASSTTVLDEGMVFSIEPGIYLPGRFGLRLEEIVYLRADGPEILSDLPRDAKLIA